MFMFKQKTCGPWFDCHFKINIVILFFFPLRQPRIAVLPLLVAVHVKGALNNWGPLQTTNDKSVGPGALCLHQLAFYETQTHHQVRQEYWTEDFNDKGLKQTLCKYILVTFRQPKQNANLRQRSCWAVGGCGHWTPRASLCSLWRSRRSLRWNNEAAMFWCIHLEEAERWRCLMFDYLLVCRKKTIQWRRLKKSTAVLNQCKSFKHDR